VLLLPLPVRRVLAHLGPHDLEGHRRGGGDDVGSAVARRRDEGRARHPRWAEGTGEEEGEEEGVDEEAREEGGEEEGVDEDESREEEAREEGGEEGVDEEEGGEEEAREERYPFGELRQDAGAGSAASSSTWGTARRSRSSSPRSR
jgi:hypothetical protein